MKKVKNVVAIILNENFWNDCAIVIQIMASLIQVLRIVDADERFLLSYVFDVMYRVRRAIKSISMTRLSNTGDICYFVKNFMLPHIY